LPSRVTSAPLAPRNPACWRRPAFLFTNLMENKGVQEIADFILMQGGVAPARAGAA
jgi:hypothetical protein